VSLSLDDQQSPVLVVEGENLAVDAKYHPVAVVNQALAEVTSCTKDEVRIRLDKSRKLSENNELILTFDPYAVLRLNVKS
jgi:hypothetical protein